jgi:tol-pal system protein YbgF
MPVLLLGSAGCFATRGDVRILQGDINTVRMESQRSAQAQAQALAETARILQAVSDSLSRLATRQVSFEGDTRGALRKVNEQLVQVQELLGQSANIIRSLRADIETSGRMMPPPVQIDTLPRTAPPTTTPGRTGAVTTPPNPAMPGPTQLYQDGMDHLRRSSYASARIAFSDLLLNYPGSEVASEAQYWIAVAFAEEKNLVAAETAYAAVVTKYPESPRAPDAMFKRALIFLQQGDNTTAKSLLEQLIKRYPTSTNVELAKERLAGIP